jgi:diguanylate cyclase (GGDEF)-like protein/PAS domain S-box-containing protein
MADTGEGRADPEGVQPDAGAPSSEPTLAATFASSLAASQSRVRTVVDQAGLAADERQLELWEFIIRARYVVVALLGCAALLPQVGVDSVWVGLGILVVGLPYTAFYHWWLRRTGVLLPIIAISDQVLPVLFVACFPTLLAPALLFMLAITANTAISFGRRIAMQSASIGFLGVCLVVLSRTPPNALPALVTYAVLAGFTTLTVGAIFELERELRRRYSDLMGGIDAIVWQQLTQHPSTLYVNEEAQHLLGYPSEAWREPRMWSRTVHPDDRMDARRIYRDALRRGISTVLEYRMIAADGRVVWVQDHVRVETDDMGRTTGVRGVMLDISATRMAQEKANQFVNLVDGIKLALFVFRLEDLNDDDTLKVLVINPEAGRLIDIDPEHAVGLPFTDVLSIPGEELVLGSLADVVRTGEGFTLDEVRPTPKGHGPRIYTGFAFPLPGDAVGLSLTDITERTMAAEVLRRQALHDGLTGLPNRTLLNERMRSAIRSSQGTGEKVALLVMDLDQFKDVNDALGHDQGDRLLIEVSRRLQKVLRHVDTIARLGGDEFAVLVADADADAAQGVADQIRETLEQPFQLGGISLQTMGSIGIALYPDHATDVEGLAQRADVAMYSAKRSGVGVSLYSSEHDQSSVRRLALLGELRSAINDGDLILHYQPSLDLDTGVAHSCEALVRWEHPQHGLMPPGEFIELAEVSGLIHPMTRWIIDQALTQIRTWLDQGIEMTVGVNLSVRNLYDRELVPWLSDLLIERGVDAHLLKLEVTESELMDDPLLALEVLGKLKALGTPTSIDDFGTGYSSLAYLKHLPIDELKIDKSFVGNMINDTSDLTIVRSTIDLSHNLGMSVVAEGVEDGETLRRLADLGCDRAQGYFVSRPVPAEQFTAWVLDPSQLDVVHTHLDLTSTGRGAHG